MSQLDFIGRVALWMGLSLVASLSVVACGGQAAGTANTRTTSRPQPTGASPTEATAQTASSGATPGPTVQSAAAQPPVHCTVGTAPTPPQTEGPYYKANPPERASLLEPGVDGTKLIVTGYVLTADCQPIPGARVDFWQADDKGQYDNAGYRLRGYQVTDQDGRYILETIVPGLYPGRTRHIHVKVQAPDHPILTTQLYFRDEPSNSRDSIFNPQLILDVQDAQDGKVARFHFVLSPRP